MPSTWSLQDHLRRRSFINTASDVLAPRIVTSKRSVELRAMISEVQNKFLGPRLRVIICKSNLEFEIRCPFVRRISVKSRVIRAFTSLVTLDHLFPAHPRPPGTYLRRLRDVIAFKFQQVSCRNVAPRDWLHHHAYATRKPNPVSDILVTLTNTNVLVTSVLSSRGTYTSSFKQYRRRWDRQTDSE